MAGGRLSRAGLPCGQAAGDHPAGFAKTEEAVRLAEREGLFFADIMTERNEITTILQRALAF